MTPEVPTQPTPNKSAQQQLLRAERVARVTRGLDGLDLWLCDLVRQGLAGLEQRPPAFWDAQATQLVDAQAPTLAARVRRLGRLTRGDVDWPVRMLHELGRIAMLSHAFRRLEELPPALGADVRQLVGLSLTHEEVLASGESMQDTWIVAGQSVSDDDRVRIQRTWLLGARSERVALLLAFAPGRAAFAGSLVPGGAFEGEIVYWPSACPLRAAVRAQRESARPPRLPGCDGIEDFRAAFAGMLARQPWLDRTFVNLRGITPVRRGDAYAVRDARGCTLGVGSEHAWPLFALSGGAPIDVGAEWDGETLTPLAVSRADGGGFYALAPPAKEDA